jgi:uncharacterized OB-fold protein
MAADKATPTRMEPPVGAESGPFWEATREGRLLIQWCTACDRGIFYPRSFCPYCAADGTHTGHLSDAADPAQLEWRQASGKGTVHAVTVEHKPSAPFANGEPYTVALIDLDEGVRMLSNVVGCPAEDVTIGMAVTVDWEPLTDGRQLPLFRPIQIQPTA